MRPSGSVRSREDDNGFPNRAASRRVPLQEKVDFLRRPEAYDPPPASVVAIETHMAWVFLAGGHAYKLKKPVKQRTLDFSTIEARRRTCREEVRLNRRLSPSIYLGVVQLGMTCDGRLVLGEIGPAQDWLVHMRRLPREGMLDRMVSSGEAVPGRLRPAAELLARFYRSLAPISMAPSRYRDRIRTEIDETARELGEPGYGVPKAEVEDVTRELEAFVAGNGPVLTARVQEGRIVEGHGDLRPEHVYLGPPPAVIDCLEFDRELRVMDAADDLSFLDLECRRLGSREAGGYFLAAYAHATGDHPPEALLSFYRRFRAFVRAKIAIRHLDHVPVDPDRWREGARRYLAMARQNRPPV